MKFELIRALAIGAMTVGATTIAHAQQNVDIAKHEYATSCAVCHGANAKGDGPLAASLKKPPSDLTTIQKNNMGVFPFDRLYEVIDGREAVAAHGPRDMPVWGDQYRTEAVGWTFGFGTPKDAESFTRGRIIALIGYIYSLQAK